jgi:adenosylcobinamide-GDP ribazoletransferase
LRRRVLLPGLVRDFLLSLGFLTTLPLRGRPADPRGCGSRAACFPLVGLVLGGLLAGAAVLLELVFPPLLCAALLVALWALLTGGLHLDGLTDSCDGLFLAGTQERRLLVLRDPRTGSFGALGLGLFLILKTASLASLRPPTLPALLLAPVLARWLVLLAALQPAARPEGMGRAFGAGLKRSVLWRSAAVPLLLVLARLLLGDWRALVAAVAGLLLVRAVIALALRRLGGITGDVLGLAVEGSELAVLLSHCLNLS